MSTEPEHGIIVMKGRSQGLSSYIAAQWLEQQKWIRSQNRAMPTA